MNVFKLIITELLYRPIYNVLLIFLIVSGWNLWIAIILLTLLVRLLLVNVTSKSNQMHQWMWDLSEQTKEIQEKYKDDPQKQSEEMMKVLKKTWWGPLKGCMMMLIQLPIFLSLYFVVRKITANEIDQTRIYSFLRDTGSHFTDTDSLNTHFFGMNLLDTGNIILAIIAAVFVFLQTKLTNIVKPKTNTDQKMPNGQAMPDMGKMMWYMSWFMMAMMWFVVYSMQAAVWLYIVTTTIFSVWQMAFQYRALLIAEMKVLFSKWKPTIVEKK